MMLAGQNAHLISIRYHRVTELGPWLWLWLRLWPWRWPGLGPGLGSGLGLGSRPGLGSGSGPGPGAGLLLRLLLRLVPALALALRSGTLVDCTASSCSTSAFLMALIIPVRAALSRGLSSPLKE
jgi:hypothetical protein